MSAAAPVTFCSEGFRPVACGRVAKAVSRPDCAATAGAIDHA